jgi:hypothetical protein
MGDDVVKEITVHHCLLMRDGKLDESWRTEPETGNGPFVLRGVSYRHSVPADTEFPHDAKPPWAVYLRVGGENTGPARVLFLVHHRNAHGAWEYLDRREIDQVIPLPEIGEETFDVFYRLPYVRFGGIGLHAISVHVWYDGIVLEENDTGDEWTGTVPEWATEPEEIFRTPDWAYRGVDYFWVERES